MYPRAVITATSYLQYLLERLINLNKPVYLALDWYYPEYASQLPNVSIHNFIKFYRCISYFSNHFEKYNDDYRAEAELVLKAQIRKDLDKQSSFKMKH